jgi:hypothetical protein
VRTMTGSLLRSGNGFAWAGALRPDGHTFYVTGVSNPVPRHDRLPRPNPSPSPLPANPQQSAHASCGIRCYRPISYKATAKTSFTI